MAQRGAAAMVQLKLQSCIVMVMLKIALFVLTGSVL